MARSALNVYRKDLWIRSKERNRSARNKGLSDLMDDAVREPALSPRLTAASNCVASDECVGLDRPATILVQGQWFLRTRAGHRRQGRLRRRF